MAQVMLEVTSTSDELPPHHILFKPLPKYVISSSETRRVVMAVQNSATIMRVDTHSTKSDTKKTDFYSGRYMRNNVRLTYVYGRDFLVYLDAAYKLCAITKATYDHNVRLEREWQAVRDRQEKAEAFFQAADAAGVVFNKTQNIKLRKYFAGETVCKK